MKKLSLIVLAVLCLAAPASAQVAGTLTWTQTRPADLSSYKVSVDGASATTLGLPATNSATLSLTAGSHTIVLSACYTDTACVASSTYTVTVSTSGSISYTSLSPADAYTMSRTGTVALSVNAVDNSGITLVTGYWSVNGGAAQAVGTTRSGDTYTFTESPTTGPYPGTRAWYFIIKAGDGEVVTTPTRSITVQ